MQFSDKQIPKSKAFSHMVKSLEELILYSENLDVKLAIETEGSLTKPGISLMENISEYENLFSIFSDSIKLNLNLAHTSFAAKAYGYDLSEFINNYYNWIIAVEISHNDGFTDMHAPLIEKSYIFNYIRELPDVPMVLEFRNASISDVKESIVLMREQQNKN
jgi:hypothetical protein